MDDHDAPLHGHLWRLADGTGLHAPAGTIQVEASTGRLCCHLCRPLVSITRVPREGPRTHRGLLPSRFGAVSGRAPPGSDLSTAISARQKAAYGTSHVVRERLGDGHRWARSGALSRASVQARALGRLLEDSGCPDLPTYLRERYRQGASLAALAAETGLGRARLRTEVAAAGIDIRSSGQNTPPGRRSRALAAEAAAAKRVGTDDLVAWLHERRKQGWTLAALGAAVGHSSHWVAWRLPRLDDHGETSVAAS